MDQTDYTRIRVGENEVGLFGLKRALEEITVKHSQSPDEEVESLLLEAMARENYLPYCAKAEYGRALLREFKRHTGQPFDEAAAGARTIVVYGPGCYMCTRLYDTVMQVLNEMKLAASLEHVTDIEEIARSGLARTPALVIDGKVVAMGTIPTAGNIKQWLSQGV